MQQPLVATPNRTRPNCFKPLVGCTLGPLLLFACIIGCACSCVASLSLTSPQPVLSSFEPDATQAALYESSIISALQTTNGNNFTVTIREEEFSSWLHYEHRELFSRYDIGDKDYWERVDPRLQVSFDDQSIKFYIGIDWWLFTLGTIITAEASVPASTLSPNLVEIEITGIQIGGLDTDSSQNSLETRLEEILTDRIKAFVQSTGVRSIEVESVNADEGILTLSGTIMR